MTGSTRSSSVARAARGWPAHRRAVRRPSASSCDRPAAAPISRLPYTSRTAASLGAARPSDPLKALSCPRGLTSATAVHPPEPLLPDELHRRDSRRQRDRVRSGRAALSCPTSQRSRRTPGAAPSRSSSRTRTGDHDALANPRFPGRRSRVGSPMRSNDATDIETSAKKRTRPKAGHGCARSRRSPALALRAARSASASAATRCSRYGTCSASRRNQIACYFPEIGLFVAGDTLSDIEIPWLDGPPWVYRQKPRKALHWVFEQEQVKHLVPGHNVAHGRADYKRLLRDIDHLLHPRRAKSATHFTLGASLSRRRRNDWPDVRGQGCGYSTNDAHRASVSSRSRAATTEMVSRDDRTKETLRSRPRVSIAATEDRLGRRQARTQTFAVRIAPPPTEAIAGARRRDGLHLYERKRRTASGAPKTWGAKARRPTPIRAPLREHGRRPHRRAAVGRRRERDCSPSAAWTTAARCSVPARGAIEKGASRTSAAAALNSLPCSRSASTSRRASCIDHPNRRARSS